MALPTNYLNAFYLELKLNIVIMKRSSRKGSNAQLLTSSKQTLDSADREEPSGDLAPVEEAPV